MGERATNEAEPRGTPGLSEFCDELFETLGRSDQRRWAEVYVRGLLLVPGRKSIRRISEEVVGRDAGQSLQQFVNQSPWPWAPVRQRLAELVNRVVRPRAWVVREVAFPKNGGSSVGVARQYAPSARRVLNCQRAVGVFLVGDRGAVPVDWRLLLPESWDDDVVRRAKSRVPEGERSRRAWQYPLECFDEMAGSWGLPVAPVVVDLSGDRDALPLLGGLEERGMRYLARVSATTPVLPVNLVGAPNGSRTVGQLVAAAAGRGRTALPRRDGATGAVTASAFVTTTLPGHARAGGGRPRHVLAEWPVGEDRPRAVWIANPGPVGLRGLVELLNAEARVGAEVAGLAEEFGLLHFEGRSFRGWHHHVTLTSAARGYRVVTGEGCRGCEDERLLRPHA
ncbi:IS701 family transposase [Saccharothrix xinjiangensis]|uniref:IS701 family transposase n=1 Tax=Saccharothrix xinjiangensis TaxID=204798 RepID=A0ABV9XSW9_9PSEU